MHTSNTDHDETLKEQIMEIVDITHSNCPYVKPCPVYNQSIRAIQEVLLQDRERAVLEGKIDLISWSLSRTSMGELKQRWKELEDELAELSNLTQEK